MQKDIKVIFTGHLYVPEGTTVGELFEKLNLDIMCGSSVFVSGVKIPVNGAENSIGLIDQDTVTMAGVYKK